MAKIGKTTGNLKLRSGPGMQYEPPIAYLVPDTELEILEDLGDWLHVRAEGKEGYVGHKYVAIQETPEAPKSDMARRDETKAAPPQDDVEKRTETSGSIKKGLGQSSDKAATAKAPRGGHETD